MDLLNLRLAWPVPGQAKETSENGDMGRQTRNWDQKWPRVYPMGSWTRKLMGWKPGGGGEVEMRLDTRDPCQVSQDPQQI